MRKVKQEFQVIHILLSSIHFLSLKYASQSVLLFVKFKWPSKWCCIRPYHIKISISNEIPWHYVSLSEKSNAKLLCNTRRADVQNPAECEHTDFHWFHGLWDERSQKRYRNDHRTSHDWRWNKTTETDSTVCVSVALIQSNLHNITEPQDSKTAIIKEEQQ